MQCPQDVLWWCAVETQRFDRRSLGLRLEDPLGDLRRQMGPRLQALAAQGALQGDEERHAEVLGCLDDQLRLLPAVQGLCQEGVSAAAQQRLPDAAVEAPAGLLTFVADELRRQVRAVALANRGQAAHDPHALADGPTTGSRLRCQPRRQLRVAGDARLPILLKDAAVVVRLHGVVVRGDHPGARLDVVHVGLDNDRVVPLLHQATG
mmetsp:Transcript_114915/g.297847  ORF Transcript_114915/g.297847 Transcript_114915/m.297847 type:complete len:207 (+) Transcript_114915:162-782(+)